MEYQIVRGSTTFKLIKMVNVMCSDGWTPLGGVAIEPDGFFVQALIKHEVPC